MCESECISIFIILQCTEICQSLGVDPHPSTVALSSADTRELLFWRKSHTKKLKVLDDAHVYITIHIPVKTNTTTFSERNDTVMLCIEGKIFPCRNSLSCPERISFLTNDNISSDNRLSTVDFYTESFCDTITTILGRSHRFFMSHKK